MIENMVMKKLDFKPAGVLSAKKSYHYLYLALAVIVPVALLIVTLVKGTFNPVTILIMLGIAVVFLGFDISTRSNMMLYNDERIALVSSILSKPVYYEWKNLTAVLFGKELGRLEFSDGKKLEFNRNYDGIDEFLAMADKYSE